MNTVQGTSTGILRVSNEIALAYNFVLRVCPDDCLTPDKEVLKWTAGTLNTNY